MKQKFRAWQKYHKKMVEVTSISFGNDGEINGVSTFVENQAPQRVTYKDGLGDFFLTDERGMVLELMQYTGLTDKNGVEIYEGDVVDYLGNIGIVGFALNNQQTMISSYSDSWIADVDYSTTINMRVLGNVYQNKDLLEGLL